MQVLSVYSHIRRAMAKSLAANGCGYMGFEPMVRATDPESSLEGNFKPPWLQLLLLEGGAPSREAAVLVYVIGDQFTPVKARRLRENQLLGLTVAAGALGRAIPFALKEGFDLLVLDGTCGIDKPWAELGGYPDLTCLREAIRILRALNSEEKLALIYYGGLRTGTDAAKVLAINCNAGAFSVAAAIAMGGAVDATQMTFDNGMSVSERSLAMERWIKATAQESMIIARSTGKTSVHNIEPEDLRSVTIATSEALGIPLVAGMEMRTDY